MMSASDGSLPTDARNSAGIIAIFDPLQDQPLGQRAQALAPGDAGPDDLHEVAEHPAVVDHAIKHLGQQSRTLACQDRAQQRRQVLHVTLGPGIESRAGDELRLDLSAQLQAPSPAALRPTHRTSQFRQPVAAYCASICLGDIA